MRPLGYTVSRVFIQCLSLASSWSVVVFSRMVILMSVSKQCSGELVKCLYKGRLCLILLAALWPAILCESVLLVCPTYWFLIWHFLHSSKYITLVVLQLVCLGVQKDL